VAGGGGGVVPLQKIFSLLGPPHGSLALPVHAMSQSVEGSETFPVKELPQSARRINHLRQFLRGHRYRMDLRNVTYSIPGNIQLLHICTLGLGNRWRMIPRSWRYHLYMTQTRECEDCQCRWSRHVSGNSIRKIKMLLLTGNIQCSSNRSVEFQSRPP
jgi:hypothetical protein